MSTYTVVNGLEKEAQQSFPQTWGVREGMMKDRLDECLDGVKSIVVNGSLSLTQATDTTDQVHFAALNITGGVGGNLYFPAITGVWNIYNGASGDVTVSIPGGGANCVVHPGQKAEVMSDGVNFRFGWNGQNPMDAVSAMGAACNAAAVALAFGSLSGSLPGQAGNAGYVLTTNGTSPVWLPITQVPGFQAALNQAVAIAIGASR